jgi:1,4-alpha-glucan branching enzyme
VWAPNAQRVSVIGSFNDWDGGKHPTQAEENGHWYTDVAEAHIGDQYRYLLATAIGAFKRIDPYAREVTSSVGNAVVHDPSLDWEGDDVHLATRNELAIYELHVGTFNDEEDDNLPSKFASVSSRLGHLKKLGVNAIQIMPIAQFAGERSWGYNPAHIFSVELAYGGPLAFKKFVKRAHRYGIAVILDVVYNHFGPGDFDLWQFDGWSENDRGGIYFYNDARARTPGETPVPITDATRSGNIFSTTSLCGLMNSMSIVCASTVPATFIPPPVQAARTCPRAGAYSNG